MPNCSNRLPEFGVIGYSMRPAVAFPSSFGPHSTFTPGLRSMTADAIPARSLTSSRRSHMPDIRPVPSARVPNERVEVMQRTFTDQRVLRRCRLEALHDALKYRRQIVRKTQRG